MVLPLIAAAAAGVIPPTSKWQVRFDESQCVASREYGSAERPLTLIFKTPAAGDVIQVAVAEKDGGSSRPEQLNGKLGWGSGPLRDSSVLSFRNAEASRKLFVINRPRAEADGASAAGVDTLTVEVGHGLQRNFGMAGLPEVLKVMDECVQDLRSYWNYVEPKAEVNPKLRSRASYQLYRLFNSGDYPRVAANQDQSGQVEVVLLIAPDGKVADCTLTATSGIAALDAQTCAIIRARARYKPAVGLDGKPARDVDHARIRWIMP